jgi:hypothetical protein
MQKIVEIGKGSIYWESNSKMCEIRQLVVLFCRFGILISNRSNGPKEIVKVVTKSIKKFEMLEFINFEFNWIINGNLRTILANFSQEKRDIPTLIGPNVEFEKFLVDLSFIKNYLLIVPSYWVIPVLQKRLAITEKKIKVWPIGIDVQYWKPTGQNRKKLIIYRKSDDGIDLKTVTNFLKKRKITYEIFLYGTYSQKKFKKSLNESFGAIWLGSTESQGIAIMQAWSMNVPTLVRRRDKYFDPITKQTFHASAAPYLTKEVGIFTSKEIVTHTDLHLFLNSLGAYNPRNYIIEHFNHKSSLEKALQLLKELSN